MRSSVLAVLFILAGCAARPVRDVCEEQPAIIDTFSRAYEEHRMTEDQGVRYIDLMYVLEAQCLSPPRSAEQQHIIDDVMEQLEALAKEVEESSPEA